MKTKNQRQGDEETLRLREIWKARFKSVWIVSILAIIGVLILFYYAINSEQLNHIENILELPIELIVSVIYIAFAGIYSTIKWRCPRCSSVIAGSLIQSLYPKVCYRCGLQLRE